MAIYLGSSDKLKINVNNTSVCMRLADVARPWLLSKDGYMLKDSNGLYLTVKEGE